MRINSGRIGLEDLLMRKYYFADLYEVCQKTGDLVLSGSKITGIWFWQDPVRAYYDLAKSGKIPAGMRRIW